MLDLVSFLLSTRRCNIRRILIVDDDLRHDKMVSFLLQSKGFDVTYALSGEEAILRLKFRDIETPDVILLDIMIPQMDGFETLKEIKKIQFLKDIPVVMLTAISDTATVEKALSLGALDYIEKPFSSSDVVSRINNIIDKVIC